MHGLALLLCAALCACQSATKDLEEPKTEPFVPLPDEDPATIGFLMTQLDKSIQRWSELKLTGDDPKEARTLDALETNLQERTRKRREDLVAVLESGPPLNREIAAVALGFTHDPTVLSPLLAALSEGEPALAQKALLGIGVLGLAETPTAQISHMMVRDPDPWTRNNAAFALQRVAAAGGRTPEVAESARAGLADEEPGVRAQCASVLGILEDEAAVEQLGHLIYDDVNLVAAAAITSLARIGRFQLQSKGQVARYLADALERVGSQRREQVLRGLVLLSDKNLGGDSEDWKEWAYRLP